MSDAPDPSQASQESSSPPPPPRRRLTFDEIIQYATTNPLNCLLFVTRLGTLILTLLHIVPFLERNSSLSYFQKALLASGTTSAIRLHQRLPSFRLNRETWNTLLSEDSCHYLLFSLLFLSHTPITMVLFPISLFAFLHLLCSILPLTEELGYATWSRKLTLFLSKYTPALLQTVALSEIFIMPILILALLTGMSNLITPFLYYRFITLRYSSHRNPYSYQTFRQLRVVIENYAARPDCPSFVRSISMNLIYLTCRLAPTIVPESASTSATN